MTHSDIEHMAQGYPPSHIGKDHEEVTLLLAARVIELQQERDALAAENAALKVISNDRRVFIMNGVQLGYIKVPTVETDPALETIRIAVSPQEPTPATDTFLNAVRAEGVDMVAEAIGSSARQLKVGSKDWMALKKVVFTLVGFSAKLRAPKGDSDAKN